MRTTLMFVVAAIGLTLATATRAEIDLSTAVGVWLFDEGAGNSAVDSSGAGNDGEFEGDPEWVDGRFGKALLFDGASAYVTIPDHENPTDALTVTVWAQSVTPGWNQPGWMVEKRDAFILHPNQGGTAVAFPVCNGGCWNLPNAWDTGAVGPNDITEWHMYTGTFDSSTGDWKIYIDAEEASTLALSATKINVDGGPMHIGWDECCGGARFGSGILDEVAVFGVALSPEDILSLYENGFEETLAVDAKGKAVTSWAALKRTRTN